MGDFLVWASTLTSICISFQEDETEDTSSPESAPYISNPMYENTAAPSAPDVPVEDVSKRKYGTFMAL